jgi:hypothetical protein
MQVIDVGMRHKSKIAFVRARRVEQNLGLSALHRYP